MSLVFDQYTDRLRRKRSSPHTIRLFADAAGRLDRWLAGQGLDAASASVEDLEAYFAQLALAPSSKNVHLRYIRAAYNYAAKRGALRRNPALDLEEEAEDPREPRVITPERLRAIRAGIRHERDWVFFHLLAYTGMRRAECVTLRWEGVRMEDETIYVIGKGRKPRYIPIHPALGEVLQSVPKGTPFVVSSTGKNGVASQTVQEMIGRLDAAHPPHDYRRTVATSLARNGVRHDLIDAILGWQPQSVRGRFYTNVAGPELQRAILRLYADDPL